MCRSPTSGATKGDAQAFSEEAAVSMGTDMFSKTAGELFPVHRVNSVGGCLFVVTQCQSTLPVQASQFSSLPQSLNCPQNPTPSRQTVAGA